MEETTGPGPEKEEQAEEEGLYDLIVPPGVPRTVIVEITKKFPVELVVRREKLTFANMEGDERELLAFRGKREAVQEAERYMVKRIREFIEAEEGAGTG